jgi:hypothetical protein
MKIIEFRRAVPPCAIPFVLAAGVVGLLALAVPAGLYLAPGEWAIVLFAELGLLALGGALRRAPHRLTPVGGGLEVAALVGPPRRWARVRVLPAPTSNRVLQEAILLTAPLFGLVYATHGHVSKGHLLAILLVAAAYERWRAAPRARVEDEDGRGATLRLGGFPGAAEALAERPPIAHALVPLA